MTDPVKHDIMDRLNDLEAEGHFIVQRMKALKVLWQQGHRYVNENDGPINLGDNIINFSEYKR